MFTLCGTPGKLVEVNMQTGDVTLFGDPNEAAKIFWDYVKTFRQGQIEVSRAEYEELQKRDFMLSCLESGGVDNWDWYSESLKDYFERYEDD